MMQINSYNGRYRQAGNLSFLMGQNKVQTSGLKDFQKYLVVTDHKGSNHEPLTHWLGGPYKFNTMAKPIDVNRLDSVNISW